MISPPLTLVASHKPLLNSDGLFFIQYIMEVSLKSRWFLVQINIDETYKLDMDMQITGDYHYVFIMSSF